METKKLYNASLVKRFLPSLTGVIEIDNFSYLETGDFWIFRVSAENLIAHVCLREGVIKEGSPFSPEAISDLETSTYWEVVGCFKPKSEELILVNDKKAKDPKAIDDLYLSVDGRSYCLYLLKKRQTS